MAHFKTTQTIREEMVGWVYQDSSGNCATVVNVVAAGGGHQVHFNCGADHNVIALLEDSERDTHTESEPHDATML